MQRGVVSLILVLNMAAGLVLSAYASEQEDSFTEEENCIITEIEEQEEDSQEELGILEIKGTKEEAIKAETIKEGKCLEPYYFCIGAIGDVFGIME